MRSTFIALILFTTQNLCAQQFDGFVITNKDSLIRGYMKIDLDGLKGRRILITDDKREKPKSFHLNDLKYYCYRKDTFAILRDFYPFEDDDYRVEEIEAKVLVGKGKTKLYHATFPDYQDRVIMFQSPTGGMPGYGKVAYSTYVVRDRKNNLIGIPYEKEKFIETMKQIVGDNQELMQKIQNKELRYKDTKKIIRIYNTR